MTRTSFVAEGREVQAQIEVRLQQDVGARNAVLAAFQAVAIDNDNGLGHDYEVTVNHVLGGNAITVEIAAVTVAAGGHAAVAHAVTAPDTDVDEPGGAPVALRLEKYHHDHPSKGA